MDRLYLLAGNLEPSALTRASQLLEKGFDPNEISRSSDGLSPIHICCIWGNYELLKLMLLYGGNATLKDKDGLTPLDWAIREGQIECAELIRCWSGGELTPCKQKDSTPKAVQLKFVDRLKQNCSPPPRSPMTPSGSGKENRTPKYFSDPRTPPASTPPRCPSSNTTASSYSPRYFTSPIKELQLAETQSPSAKVVLPRLSEITRERGIIEESQLTMLCSAFSDSLSITSEESSHSSDPTWVEESFSDNNIARLSIISEEQSSGDITIVSDDFKQTVKRPYLDVKSDKTRLSMAVCADVFPPPPSFIETPDISCTSTETCDGLDLPDDIVNFVTGLTNVALKRELTGKGVDVGPVTKSTRLVYERKLGLLLLEGRRSEKLKYSGELENMIKSGRKPVAGETDDRLSVRWFQDPHRSWRGGIIPKSFVYLLLHPDLSKSGPKEATLQTFVDSIFYVGKGSGSRPLQHLFEAAECFKPSIEGLVKSEKIQTIMKIWRSGQGVLLLELFHHIIPAEAHTKEAAVIDAIGLQNLTNVVKGTYYGVACSWTASQQRRCGAYLIYQFWLFYRMIGARPVPFTSLT